MRTITALALAASLSFSAPALAYAQGTPAPAASSAKKSVQISKIQVIDIKSLPDTVKAQVEDVASKSTDEDMKGLRASIDASPAAASALKEKGVTSAQVVAINIADGVLTMFTRAA